MAKEVLDFCVHSQIQPQEGSDQTTEFRLGTCLSKEEIEAFVNKLLSDPDLQEPEVCDGHCTPKDGRWQDGMWLEVASISLVDGHMVVAKVRAALEELGYELRTLTKERVTAAHERKRRLLGRPY